MNTNHVYAMRSIHLSQFIEETGDIRQSMRKLADKARGSGLFSGFSFTQFYALQGPDPEKHARVLLRALYEYALEHGVTIR